MGKALKIEDIDLSPSIDDKDEYKLRLKTAQLQLLYLQRFLYEENRRVVLVFEGRDAAGKGGSIRRIVERLDPRGYRVHAIGAPERTEWHRHYLHRFWVRLPKPGSIGIFDRSWYGRVLVERVEKFCEKEEWQRAYGEINNFEKLLVDDGVPVLKFFLTISDKEQLKRFKSREDDPFRSWKLTDEDWRNRDKNDKYDKAFNDMFEQTHTKHAPWNLISSEHKWYGRVAVLETIVSQASEFFDTSLKLPKGWKALRD